MTNLKAWHKSVLENYNYICQGCKKDYSAECYFQEDNNGRVNQMLTGHHLLSQKSRPDLVLDVSNGISVDQECHNKIHQGIIKVED